jgi:hypothetical protein
VKEKEKAFSEHTQKAFSALRDARGVGVEIQITAAVPRATAELDARFA